MAKTIQEMMQGVLVEICEGLHPLPEGWMFQALLASEHCAYQVKMVGNRVEVWEEVDDANGDGD